MHSYLNNTNIIRLFKYYLVFIFISTVVSGFYYYITNHNYCVGDWLINYQSGFIRRGFIGEIFYQFSYFTTIDIGILVFLFQITLYYILFYLIYLLVTKQESLRPYIFVLFSPFLISFHIHDLGGGFRKEILYFVVLAVTVYLSFNQDIEKFKKSFLYIILVYPLLVLSHELLIVFFPYLLIIYIYKIEIKNITLLKLFLFSLPSLFAFVIVLLFKGDLNNINLIYESLQNINYVLASGGSIDWLNKSSKDGFFLVYETIIINGKFLYTLLAICLGLFAFYPLKDKIVMVFAHDLSKLLILLSLVGTFVVMLVAIDWGRFVYIHLLSLFFVSLLNNTYLIKESKYKILDFTKRGIKILFFCYILLWNIPHATPKMPIVNKSKKFNLFGLFNPYKKLYYYKENKGNI